MTCLCKKPFTYWILCHENVQEVIDSCIFCELKQVQHGLEYTLDGKSMLIPWGKYVVKEYMHLGSYDREDFEQKYLTVVK